MASNVIGAIFSKAGEGILNAFGNVLDNLFTNKEEKAQALLALEQILSERLSEAEETLRHRNEMTARIIEAEMKQGDGYTKRARPSIIYVGLLIAFGQMLVLPALLVLGQITPVEAKVFQTYGNHPEFWLAWAGVAGVYAFGRSREKMGDRGKLAQAMTGNGGGASGALTELMR